jgi:hypothetical protein
LPGANRDDVHYPGPRIRLTAERPSSQVELVAYDAVESPSPLDARRHEMKVRAERGFLDVEETLVIENPSRRAYVGESSGEGPPLTIRLAIPSGFETVTFEQEFYGRNFLVYRDMLVSDLPWPPGTRELKFHYRLPVEHRRRMLARTLDLPTDHVLVRVAADDARRVACNLPQSAESSAEETVFEHQGDSLAAGHSIELNLAALNVRWEAQTRWLALGLLVVAVTASVAWSRRRRLRPSVQPRGLASRPALATAPPLVRSLTIDQWQP